MDGLFTPFNKELNTDTCQQREGLLGDGKFQCVISVTPGTSDSCKERLKGRLGEDTCEGEVKAVVGFCERSPECGNVALPDDPCEVADYFWEAAKASFYSAGGLSVPRNVKMPIYEGMEPSVEMQSTEAFKSCEENGEGEAEARTMAEVMNQIKKIGNCISDMCS